MNEKRCNAESITTDTLERLMQDLDNDYLRRFKESAKKLKLMRQDHYHEKNEKDKVFKQKYHQAKTLKDVEAALSKEQKHLRESMAAKKVEIEMLKEEIDRNKQVEIENTILKRNVANLMANLEKETNKLQVDTKDLEKKVKDWKSKCKIAID